MCNRSGIKNALSFNIRFLSLYYNLKNEKYVLIDSPFMNVYERLNP